MNDAGADLAFTIGQANTNDVFGSGPAGELAYVATHAALGCAASAAEGTGCAGGAIGAAASAAVTPFFISAVDQNGSTELNPGQSAIVTALAALTGSAAAGLSGANAQAGATWAENEAQNYAQF